MTQREMDLMRALAAAQAALWDVVDGEHNAMAVLRIMVGVVMRMTREMEESR